MQLLFAATTALLVTLTVGAPRTSRVQTSSGAIIGHQASNRTSVTEFLGIRYAESPVGELRFAAPKKYVAPAGTVFEASEWVCHFRQDSRYLILTWLVSRLSVQQAANKQLPKLYTTVRPAGVEELCGTEQQLCI